MGKQYMSELQMADNLDFLKIIFLPDNVICNTVDYLFACSSPITFPRIL